MKRCPHCNEPLYDDADDDVIILEDSSIYFDVYTVLRCFKCGYRKKHPDE